MHEVPFGNVLAGYVAARHRCDRIETEESQLQRSLFTQLIGGYTGAWNQWAKTQEGSADDFNLFTVLNVAYDELRHSMLLAWLLDRRIEYGTHAQGSRGLELFLKEVGLDATYATHAYWVRREVSCSRSRVDLEIAARGVFIIHIENKIRAAEGEAQTYREWEGLNERRKELDIKPENTYGFFLTVDGTAPQSPEFKPIRWNHVAKILEAFAGEPVMADAVKLFVRHSALAIRRLASADILREEVSDGEATV